VAGYVPRWFISPQMVTHPCTNLARRRVTTLIETNTLPLTQATMAKWQVKNQINMTLRQLRYSICC